MAVPAVGRRDDLCDDGVPFCDFKVISRAEGPCIDLPRSEPFDATEALSATSILAYVIYFSSVYILPSSETKVDWRAYGYVAQKIVDLINL